MFGSFTELKTYFLEVKAQNACLNLSATVDLPFMNLVDKAKFLSFSGPFSKLP